MEVKSEEKNYLNEHPKNNKNEKYKAKTIEVAGLDKSRIKQLMQLKEEGQTQLHIRLIRMVVNLLQTMN